MIVDLRHDTVGLDGYEVQEGVPGRISIVPDPTGRNRLVGRYDIHAGDPEVKVAKRTETTTEDIIPLTFETPHWYTGEFLLPDDGKIWNELSTAPFQFHDVADEDDVKRAPTLLGRIFAPDDTLVVYTGYDDPPTDPTTVDPDRTEVARIKLRRGRWYHWRLEVSWAYTANGYQRFYLDGHLLYSFTGINTYQDAIPPHAKQGNYLYGEWANEIHTSRTVYQAGFLIGVGEDYEALYGPRRQAGAAVTVMG